MTDKEKLVELLDRAHRNVRCVIGYDGSEGEALEEEARYLLSHGVIVLPCKAGDKVYDISEFAEGCPYPEMYEFTADYIGIGKSEDRRTVITIDCMDYYIDDFGKTVFLSEEEAEAALKGE